MIIIERGQENEDCGSLEQVSAQLSRAPSEGISSSKLRYGLESSQSGAHQVLSDKKGNLSEGKNDRKSSDCRASNGSNDLLKKSRLKQPVAISTNLFKSNDFSITNENDCSKNELSRCEPPPTSIINGPIIRSKEAYPDEAIKSRNSVLGGSKLKGILGVSKSSSSRTQKIVSNSQSSKDCNPCNSASSNQSTVDNSSSNKISNGKVTYKRPRSLLTSTVKQKQMRSKVVGSNGLGRSPNSRKEEKSEDSHISDKQVTKIQGISALGRALTGSIKQTKVLLVAREQSTTKSRTKHTIPTRYEKTSFNTNSKNRLKGGLRTLVGGVVGSSTTNNSSVRRVNLSLEQTVASPSSSTVDKLIRPTTSSSKQVRKQNALAQDKPGSEKANSNYDHKDVDDNDKHNGCSYGPIHGSTHGPRTSGNCLAKNDGKRGGERIESNNDGKTKILNQFTHLPLTKAETISHSVASPTVEAVSFNISPILRTGLNSTKAQLSRAQKGTSVLDKMSHSNLSEVNHSKGKVSKPTIERDNLTSNGSNSGHERASQSRVATFRPNHCYTNRNKSETTNINLKEHIEGNQKDVPHSVDLHPDNFNTKIANENLSFLAKDHTEHVSYFPDINKLLSSSQATQQVLSLMMLDVGLMPAESSISNLQTICDSVNKRDAYVHIQDLSESDCGFIDDLDTNWSVLSQTDFLGSSLNKPNKSNIPDLVRNGSKSCADKPSFLSNNDALRLDIPRCINLKDGKKSISLPTSPLLNRRKCSDASTNQSLDSSTFNSSSNLAQIENISTSHHFDLNYRNSSSKVHDIRQPDSREPQSSNSSSSCSSMNYHPPLLAISNRLNKIKLDELMKGSLNHLVRSSSEIGQDHSSVRAHSSTKEQNDGQLSQKRPIDSQGRVNFSEALKSSSPNKIDGSSNDSTIKGHKISNRNNHPINTRDENLACSSPNHQLSERNEMEPPERRQKCRSNSMIGHDFNYSSYENQQNNMSNDRYQTQQIGFLTNQLASMYSSNSRTQQTPSPYLNLNKRSISPSNMGTHNISPAYFQQQREYNIQNGSGLRSPRNQLHASLESINSTVNCVEQIHNQFNQNHHHSQQQPISNQRHYAASYILATPPANTIINQSGELDLAAAAMGPNPIRLHHIGQDSRLSPYNQQHNSNISTKPFASQISQSPLRRMSGLNSTTNIMNQPNSNNILSSPIRGGYSSLSLTSSSLIIEEKLQNEIKKLQSELRSEREKNEALNSQLNINSNLMQAFEQSLTTLNTRLRQLATLNEKKDCEINDLHEKLKQLRDGINNEDRITDQVGLSKQYPITSESSFIPGTADKDNISEQEMGKQIQDLKKQLIEKDRLLTDMRLEALSAAHQLEQLESKMAGDQVNEDDLDEGVLMTNHSPSDSDAITDSVHVSEMNGRIHKQSSQNFDEDNINPHVSFSGEITSNCDRIVNREQSSNSSDHNYNESDRRSQNSDDLIQTGTKSNGDTHMITNFLDGLLVDAEDQCQIKSLLD